LSEVDKNLRGLPPVWNVDELKTQGRNAPADIALNVEKRLESTLAFLNSDKFKKMAKKFEEKFDNYAKLLNELGVSEIKINEKKIKVKSPTSEEISQALSSDIAQLKDAIEKAVDVYTDKTVTDGKVITAPIKEIRLKTVEDFIERFAWKGDDLDYARTGFQPEELKLLLPVGEALRLIYAPFINNNTSFPQSAYLVSGLVGIEDIFQEFVFDPQLEEIQNKIDEIKEKYNLT
jgi:hypothetical protein